MTRKFLLFLAPLFVFVMFVSFILTSLDIENKSQNSNSNNYDSTQIQENNSTIPEISQDDSQTVKEKLDQEIKPIDPPSPDRQIDPERKENQKSESNQNIDKDSKSSVKDNHDNKDSVSKEQKKESSSNSNPEESSNKKVKNSEKHSQDSTTVQKPIQEKKQDDKKNDSVNKSENKNKDKSSSSSDSKSKTKSNNSNSKPKQITEKRRPVTQHPKTSHYGSSKTVRAGSDSRTIAQVSGNGSIRLVFSRDGKSSAPNIPTFVSAICGANSVYSGAFNTTVGKPFSKTIPFNGNCKIKALVTYPSGKWRGSYNAVKISYGNIQKQSGNGYFSQAKWKTRPVSKSSTFNFSSPNSFKGNVVLKMTACSSRNGASDKTATNACDGHVRKDVGSSGTIEIRNNGKLVASQNYSISYKKHHDTFTIRLPKLNNKNVSVTVKKKSGSSVLVHGTGGSSIVGIY